jgi:hypothetical protein
MLPTDHAEIELLESDELPVRTLVAPPMLARELRLVLAGMDLTIQLGSQDAVIISTDLYAAFQEWSRQLAVEDDNADSETDLNWN